MMAKKYLVKNSNVLVAKKSRNKLNYYLKTLGEKSSISLQGSIRRPVIIYVSQEYLCKQYY